MVNTMNDDIGSKLLAARTAQQMSREELADRVAALTSTPFRQQAVFRIERGVRPLRYDEAVALAQILQVPLGHFAGIEDGAAMADLAAENRQLRTQLAAIRQIVSSPEIVL